MQFPSCLKAGQWLKSIGLFKGWQLSGAVLHSSREMGKLS